MGSRFPVRCGGTHDQEDQSWAHRPFRPRSMGGRRKAQSRGSCHTPDARDVLLSGVLDVQTQQIRPRSSMALRHARRWRRACDLPSRFLPASAVEPTLLAGPIRSALDGAPPSVDATGPPHPAPPAHVAPLLVSGSKLHCSWSQNDTIFSSGPYTMAAPSGGTQSSAPGASSIGREGNLTRRRFFPGDGLSVLLVDEVPDRLRIVQVAHRELDAGLAGT